MELSGDYWRWAHSEEMGYPLKAHRFAERNGLVAVCGVMDRPPLVAVETKELQTLRLVCEICAKMSTMRTRLIELEDDHGPA